MMSSEHLLEFEAELRKRERMLDQREADIKQREMNLNASRCDGESSTSGSDDDDPEYPTTTTSSSSSTMQNIHYITNLLGQRKFIKTIVFGALDGVTTTVALICSVVALSDQHNLTTWSIFVLGLANLIADGFSMGMGDFLSSVAQKDSRTVMHHHHHSNHNTNGIKISVSSLCHRYGAAMKSGIVMFASFVFFGGIPLLAFIGTGTVLFRFRTACALCCMSLFLLGYWKGKVIYPPAASVAAHPTTNNTSHITISPPSTMCSVTNGIGHTFLIRRCVGSGAGMVLLGGMASL
eukprot:PhF_6_TR3686/c0_g1_i4/m.5241